ncbi:MAG: hypothetical protein AAFX10_16790, partial [Pseudomonadota bacterium]
MKNSYRRMQRLLCGCAGVLVCGGLSAAGLLIENVTLIDGTGRPPVTGASVLIRDDRIAAVSQQPLQLE